MSRPVDDRELPRGVATLGDQPVEIHFDGACQPPRGGGVATYGFTVDGGGFAFEDRGLAAPPYSERSTNNVAEYVAVIRALEWLHGQGYRGEVRVLGDSQLVIRQVEGTYEVRAEHLRAYLERLRQLRALFARVFFEWIPREQNARADELSKRALREAVATAPVPNRDADDEPTTRGRGR